MALGVLQGGWLAGYEGRAGRLAGWLADCELRLASATERSDLCFENGSGRLHRGDRDIGRHVRSPVTGKSL